MPDGKRADEVCANLDTETLRCLVWETNDYPEWCRQFLPDQEFCGSDRNEALQILRILERST
jgi:hypothetical protein